jgi:predicted outer membrane protein
MSKSLPARATVILFAAAALSACTTTRHSKEPAPTQHTTVVDPAAQREYLQTAESLNQFEAESSRLALQLSSDFGVRALAQTFLNDSQQMSAPLLAAGLTPGAGLMTGTMLPQHSNMLQQLSYGDPTSFSEVYRNMQVMTHMQAINLHRSYLQANPGSPLAAFASNSLAVAQAHLAAAQALQIAPPQPNRPVRRPGRDI